MNKEIIYLSKVLSINLGIFVFILFFIEILARVFSGAILFGNSKNLFNLTDPNYITNCSSCKAISFGKRVYLDKNGFRKSNNILINNREPNKIISFS